MSEFDMPGQYKGFSVLKLSRLPEGSTNQEFAAKWWCMMPLQMD
jgi:hypothetical protein